MSYEDWLDNIDKLKSNVCNLEIIEKLQNEDINENINYLLKDKLDELVDITFANSIQKIIRNIEFLFEDQYELELTLINFKKKINAIMSIASLKQFGNDSELIKENIRRETDRVFKLLEKESLMFDDIGGLLVVIRKNEINWGEL